MQTERSEFLKDNPNGNKANGYYERIARSVEKVLSSGLPETGSVILSHFFGNA